MPWSKNVIPQEGDLLRVKRKVGYYHYGIALSSDEVIHFAGTHDDDILNTENIKIRRAPMSIFKKEDTVEVMTPFESPFTRKEVISRAKEFYDSSLFRAKHYDFLLNNCEHFARYVYYNNPRSTQVTRGLTHIAIRAFGLIENASSKKSIQSSKVIEIDATEEDKK